ncbi:MAG: hypothetical protein ACP5RF_01380 [Candidatus Micrarchaeia archaeon]
MQISEKAKEIIVRGSIKVRVRRSGMLQQLTFSIKKVKVGDLEYVELYTNRIVDTSELLRVSEETGLPVEAPNGKAFPKGTAASDFVQ